MRFAFESSRAEEKEETTASAAVRSCGGGGGGEFPSRFLPKEEKEKLRRNRATAEGWA